MRNGHRTAGPDAAHQRPVRVAEFIATRQLAATSSLAGVRRGKRSCAISLKKVVDVSELASIECNLWRGKGNCLVKDVFEKAKSKTVARSHRIQRPKAHFNLPCSRFSWLRISARGLLLFCAFVASAPAAAQSSGGDLPYIAVTEVVSTVDSRAWNDYRNTKAANFQTMLETQLTKINRFRIMERNRVDQVLAEQGLQAELSTNNTSLGLQGVDYIVYGSITKFGTDKQDIRTGSFASVKTTATFGVDIKVVHVPTGEIRIAENVEETVVTGSGLATGNFRHSDGAGTPLADVQRAAARKTAALITSSIFPIKVVAVDGEAIYLNFGDAMLEVGDLLDIVREGKAFVDPDTGRSLGATRRKVGRVRVSETTSEFSTAQVVSGDAPNNSDIAVFVGKSRGQGQQAQRQNLGRRI